MASGAKVEGGAARALCQSAQPAITPADRRCRQRLGCSCRQLDAARWNPPGAALMPMAAPSACSSGTSSTASPAGFAQRVQPVVRRGYSLDADGNGINDNWDKLSAAIATGEVDAAFMATSWGAFQIMGEWWDALGYQSPFAMAFACVASEAAHLDMLARYIEHFRLKPALAALTSNPATCRAFAAAYNAPATA
jgi:hypothetical protein